MNSPLFSFHLLSDVHVNGTSSVSELYKNALLDMAQLDTQKKCPLVVAGDLTGRGAEEQYEEFFRITYENAPTCPENLLLLLGNHDARGPVAEVWNREPELPCPGWEQRRELYLSLYGRCMPSEKERCGLSFKREIGGYTFLMLNTEKGLKDAAYFGPEQLEFLEECMRTCWQNDPGKPVFLVCHQALNNTHWRSNVLDAFDGLSNEPGTGPAGKPKDYSWHADEKVKQILTRYPCGVFLSGHIHNQFGVAELQLRPFGAALDLPAFGEPELGCPDKGTGYEVEIWPDKVLFRARNFAKGQWMPQYDQTLPLPALPVVLKKTGAPIPGEMEQIYNQEGMAWDFLGLPEKPLFAKDTLAKLEEVRKTLL